MSGIFGIYHPDRQAINTIHLQKMASSIAHRGPDGTKTISHDFIGLGHSMLQTTPESTHEQSPYTHPTHGLVITADARIDNRSELFDKLNLRPQVTTSDSQLILAAYIKWGTKSFIHLLGDFSFVIWNPSKQVLLCVRDYIGVKPFYYHYSPTKFLFSSEIKQLAEHPEIQLDTNKKMVAEYLSFSFCSKTETLFRHIQRLSPGHYLKISPQGLTKKEYWSLNTENKIYYSKSKSYTEHFLHIFEQAVECRLRCNTRVSAELSGGLDSSSVVAMACKILDRRKQPELKTFGMTFPNLQFDESHYINLVASYLGHSVQHVESQHFTEPMGLQQTMVTFEPPDIPNIVMRDALVREVCNSDSRVLLSGIGGDEWFTGSGYPYLDLLRDKKYSALISQLRFSLSYNKPYALKRFLINLLWPAVPIKLRRALCKKSYHINADWLTDEFIQTTHLYKQFENVDPRLPLSNLSSFLISKVISSGAEQFFLETMDRYHALRGIEYRSPFLDRRMLEFSISIPEYQHQYCGITKRLLRHQDNPLLPKRLQTRHSKADFSYFFGKTFHSEKFIKETEDMTIAQAGWIDHGKLLRQIAKKRNHFQADKYSIGHNNWELWMVYAVEVWYKNVLKTTTGKVDS